MRPYRLYLFKRNNTSAKNSHKIMLCYTGSDGYLPDRSIKQKGYGHSVNYVGWRDLYLVEKNMVDCSNRVLFHFYDTIDELIEDEMRFDDYNTEFVSMLEELRAD